MSDDAVRILIIDDDEAIRETFQQILVAKGYDVDSAGTFAEAMRKLKQSLFNIALVDLKMPDASGLEVLKAIGEINKDVVSIMVTAYASFDSVVEAMNEGAYSYVTKPVNIDEFLITLTRAIEKQRLVIENKRLVSELKKRNESLLDKMCDLQEKEQLLYDANQKLEKLNNMKSNFVAHVSHEFKNPLSAIKESIDLVVNIENEGLSESQIKLLGAGKRSTERLINLVEDLLDVSTIESGRLQLKREKVDVAFLAQNVMEVFEQIALKRGITLAAEIDKDIGSIYCDRERMTDVFTNLISNAVKYTPEGGDVSVKLFGFGKDIRFEVSDTGSGIDEKDFEKLFDRFERLSTGNVKGTGLGLPIAKSIVEYHRGNIWVESEVGKGSTFIVTLPRDLREDR